MSFRQIATILLLCCAALLMAACNFNDPDTTPTPQEEVVEETIVPLPDNPSIPTASATASPTLSIVQIASPTGTPSPLPPSITPTPSPTLGPWEHVVQSGETLFGIVGQPPYNYRDPSIIDAVLELNNLPSADSIVAGQTLLIPRPTPTPIPVGGDMTATANALLGIDEFGLPPNTVWDCHVVQEGEVIVSIIQQYGGATLANIAERNPDINFFGCDFEQPSGGPDCSPNISPNQCVNVPLPTPTPTLSPTPSGNETATPTPTYRPPNLISPPQGVTVSAGRLDLQWLSVGQLAPNEFYIVEVRDATVESEPELFQTRATSLELPASLIPTDGQIHTFTWTVRVGVRTDDGTFVYIGSPGFTGTFLWQSR